MIYEPFIGSTSVQCKNILQYSRTLSFDVPMEGLAQSSRIAVYLLPCVLIWDADLALIAAEADMEAVALLELLIEHHYEIVG